MKLSIRRIRLGKLASGIAFAGLLLAGSLRAEEDAGLDAGVTAPADGGSASEAETDPRTGQIRALIAGTLPVAITPQSLFEVRLTDEPALQVEAVRLRVLLRAVGATDAGTEHSTAKPIAPSSPLAATRREIEALDPAQWSAREALDRARLDFYSLSEPQRAALLSAQAARVEAAKPKETDEARRAREANEERQRALEAARTARSEAERLVGTELARLIGVERAVATAEDGFKDARVDLAARKDSLLGWQRRVMEAQAGSASAADDTYDAVRKTLRGSRDDLDHALDDLAALSSALPNLGPDPLSDIPSDVPTDHVRQRRAAIAKLIDTARAKESALREDRASTLLDEIDSLNRARLGLLAYLSPEKQAAITGFTAAGLDQARSEGRQLLLILRYHKHVAEGWVGDLRDHQGIAGISVWRIGAVVVPWAIAAFAFIWLRRRDEEWLAEAEERLAEADRREQRAAPSALRVALRFFTGFHRTFEWLIFYAVSVGLLPAGTRSLLEVQLVEVIVGWTLGGALIVNVINAIATAADASGARSSGDVGALRLRSLRLVGRVVVVFVLVLLVSARLVGEGTVYRWVSSTCWFAAVPVFLILVRWWRSVVFERVERVRRKSELQAFILANRRGWKSFFAAMIGAVQLFATGVYKIVRNWVTSFNLARRAHAYLFKRELDRLAGDKSSVEFAELGRAAFVSLAPDRASETWIESSAARQLAAYLDEREASPHGVIAIIGARGSGKTSLLRRFGERHPTGTLAFTCTGDTSFAEVRTRFEHASSSARPAAEAPARVLLDDAQSLTKPIRGGLHAFDEALTFARKTAGNTLWVFAIDAVVWPFLSRARDARPLFDDVITLSPWSDEQIGELLSQRSAEAGISPTFEDLLEKLSPTADEIDKQEALAARRAGYFRMVWDYARGNPAMALEVWRASLTEDATGAVRVRSLVAPDASELEALPDSGLFILRAIMQMEPATVGDVAKATHLAEAHVENAVRFGQNHGYLVAEAGKVRVAWPWLRSVVGLLERRHLLVNT